MDRNTTKRTTKRIGALIASSRYLVLLILLGLAVHLVLPQLTSLEHSLQVIKRLVLWAVALAVVAQVLSYLGSGYLLRGIVAITHQRFSVVKGIMMTLASSSVGVVAGGMVGTAAATYRWMRSRGVSSEGATLAGILPLLFNNVILILAAIFGLIHLLIVHQLSPIQSISFSLILLLLGAGLGGALWGVRHRSESTALAVRVASRWARIRRKPYTSTETEDAIARLFSAWDALHGGEWRGPALGCSVQYGLRYADTLFPLPRRCGSYRSRCAARRLWITVTFWQDGVSAPRRGWRSRRYDGYALYRAWRARARRRCRYSDLPPALLLGADTYWLSDCGLFPAR